MVQITTRCIEVWKSSCQPDIITIKVYFFFIGNLCTDVGENVEGAGRLVLNEAAAFLQNGDLGADLTGRISERLTSEKGVGQLPSDKLPVRTTIVYGTCVLESMRHSKQKKNTINLSRYSWIIISSFCRAELQLAPQRRRRQVQPPVMCGHHRSRNACRCVPSE